MGPSGGRILRGWRAVISEVRLAAVVLAVGVALSIAVYLGVSGAFKTGSESSALTSVQGRSSNEGPGEMVFSPTGNYVAGDSSMPLLLHAWEMTPDYILVVYTLVGNPADAPQSLSPGIADDKGRSYRVLDNAILGSVDGVLAGVLVVEPYIPGGSVLTIQADSVVLSGGVSRSGNWSMPFLKTTHPDISITFIEGGRLSPEEGVYVNGTTVGQAGPPGASPVEVLVHRDGKTTSLFGAVDRDGTARALGLGDFQEKTGIPNYPKPPTFPASAAVGH